ncbi:MAG: hypothetical protein GWP91_00135 [Rhodobacterales bacterium]|nr:hypothetical protein [Rhodobacterales bacterium]
MRSQIPVEYLHHAWRVLPDGLVWTEVLADSPRPAAMSSAWGAYLVRRGETATALLAYEQASLISPNSRHAYHPTYIALLADFNRHDEALQRAYVGREANPQSETHIRLIVNLLQETGQHQLALDTYRQNIKSHPSLVTGYLVLLSQNENADIAFRELKRISLTNGANPEAAMAVAAMFAKTGQLKKCRDAMLIGQSTGIAMPNDVEERLVNRCTIMGSDATKQRP